MLLTSLKLRPIDYHKEYIYFEQELEPFFSGKQIGDFVCDVAGVCDQNYYSLVSSDGQPTKQLSFDEITSLFLCLTLERHFNKDIYTIREDEHDQTMMYIGTDVVKLEMGFDTKEQQFIMIVHDSNLKETGVYTAKLSDLLFCVR